MKYLIILITFIFNCQISHAMKGPFELELAGIPNLLPSAYFGGSDDDSMHDDGAFSAIPESSDNDRRESPAQNKSALNQGDTAHSSTQKIQTLQSSHQIRRHPHQKKQYICPVPECGQKFTGATGLKIHKRKHTGEKPFKCETCGYTCVSNSLLKAHLLTHSEEKPFTCPEPDCTYAAARADHLEAHKKSHAAKPVLKCRQCEFKTDKPSQLRIHERIHSGGTIHQCKSEGCDYITNDARSLETHKRTHTNSKPYNCECGYACRTSSQLKVHKTRNHPDSNVQPLTNNL